MYKHPILYLLLFVWLGTGCSGNGSQDEVKSDQESETAKKAPPVMKNILFFGNSLTAGYGLNPSESFPALIQKKIDSLNLPYKAINAGLSGETSAGGKNRIDWLLRQPVDVFVLELGANDGLRGIPPTETKKNLQAIVDKVKAKYPEAKLVMAGMEVPPNMGGAYASEFRVIFRQLAEQNNMALVPFLLEGVGGVRSLNQADGVHPTAEGQKILASNVWEVLKGVL
ncbi:arylesterase [Rufibacter sediminis]|uniref:Arylesterase n=1 Tax=Rufibacter sediminis TaxID=2762756 RepID=A0ABR6VSP4_9BACT|nr:arylesterase [Rufibacter sediminis]MBC3540228.1 arylesterase [Rufibacter sediminis]